MHCRDFDFAGQQQVALKLHNLAGPKDDFYIWWAIVAIALQAKAAAKGKKTALPAEKLFQLAELMAAKQAQKQGIKTYEQLMLFLDILKVLLHTACLSLLGLFRTCVLRAPSVKRMSFACGVKTHDRFCHHRSMPVAAPDSITAAAAVNQQQTVIF